MKYILSFLLCINILAAQAQTDIQTATKYSVRISQSVGLANRIMVYKGFTDAEKSAMKNYKGTRNSFATNVALMINGRHKQRFGIQVGMNFTGFETKIIKIPTSVHNSAPQTGYVKHTYRLFHYSLSAPYEQNVMTRKKISLYLGLEPSLNYTALYQNWNLHYSYNSQTNKYEKGLTSSLAEPETPNPKVSFTTTAFVIADFKLTKRLDLTLSPFYTQYWHKFQSIDIAPATGDFTFMFINHGTFGYLYNYGVRVGLNYRF